MSRKISWFGFTTTKDFCRTYNVNYQRFCSYRAKYRNKKDWNKDDIINKFGYKRKYHKK